MKRPTSNRPKPLKRFVPPLHIDDLIVSSRQAKRDVASRPKVKGKP
jgi:hypothetical protein